MAPKYSLALLLMLLISVVTSLPSFSQDKSDAAAAQELMTYYVDLIQSGNYESAMGLWEPSATERATRLDINYDGIPVKADCVSPILNNPKDMKEILSHGVLGQLSVLDSGVYRMKVGGEVGPKKIEYFYYMRKIGKDFWLIFPQDYYAAGWPVKESKYFRFHINPKVENFYNDVAVTALDDFVDSIGYKLAIPLERLRLLAVKKMDYYFCQSEMEVAELASTQVTKGVYDLGSDAIITSIFPHFHELAHSLVNFKLQNLPLFTVPFIQEGTAVFLGGRWQRAPEVMIDFGQYILDYKITELDSVLINKDAENTISADINYPVSACLMDYLYSSLGRERFFDLYRALSGSFEFYVGATPDSIKSVVSSFLGKSWPDVSAGFASSLEKRTASGGLIFPGEVSTDKVLVSDRGLTISKSLKWLKVEYSAPSDSLNKADINFLFDRVSSMDGKKSSMFDEQYKDSQKFEGYRYGIRLDKNEVGLYDYCTNQLMAKYIYDFDPSPKYFDSTANKYSAYFDISLLGKTLPDKSDYRIIK